MPDFKVIKLAALNLLSYRKNSVGARISCIYFISLLVFILLLVPISNKILDIKTHNILVTIEQNFDFTTQQLSYLLTPKRVEMSCEENLFTLRKSVFNSDQVKEIGLFDRDGNIYCVSNGGSTSFTLYKNIMNRIEKSSDNVTLSYTLTKFSRTQSIVLVFTNKTGQGISVLIPPRYLLKEVDERLSTEHVNYRLSIVSKNLSHHSFKKGAAQYSAQSKKYPLKIIVSSTTMYYIIQFWRYCWIALLLASFISISYIIRQRKVQNSNSLESSLRYAIENDYLELHYQPIVNQKTGHTVGCESLLRWKDPIQGYISPEIFIPLAEKVNLIEDITKLVIRKVILLLTEEPSLFEQRYISVNISRSVILKPSFLRYVEMFMKYQPELARKIIFEITEDNNFSSEELKALKNHLLRLSSEYGFKFAVDDFGTGYSGLDFIRQFPFDYVKIDRVFVKSLYDDSTIIPLLDSMMTLATQLNMMTIVEGVEEKSQLEILDRLGFIYIQGYYYSKPLPKSKLIEYLND